MLAAVTARVLHVWLRGIRPADPWADGNVNHAAMKFGDGVIIMGYPGPGYKSPKRLGQATQQLYIYVEDVDKHFDRARNAGATILEEPEDQFYGDRRYAAGQLNRQRTLPVH